MAVQLRDDSAQLGAVLQPVIDRLKARVGGKLRPDNLRQGGPLFLVLRGDYTPAVVAFARVTIVRRGGRGSIAHRLRIDSGRCRLHQIRADHKRRCLGLRQVDERAFLLTVPMQHAGNNNNRAQRSRNIIGKYRLRTDGRVGDARVVPHVGKTGKRSNIDADRREMSLGAGGAKTGHAQIDDIRFHSAQLLVAETDTFDDVDAVVV